MKLSIIFSILLIITTTLSALHELEHISHDVEDENSCLVYHINDKLSAVDEPTKISEANLVFLQKIPFTSQVLNTHLDKKSNPSHAPPLHS